jgi:hypothetical protein
MMEERNLFRIVTSSAMLGIVGCGASGGEVPTAPALHGDAPEEIVADRGGETTVVTVPIRGSWENTESPPSASPPAGCQVHIETTQVGQATHLGRFTGRGQTCVTSQVLSDDPPFWTHDPAPPYGVMGFENEMVWMAANGDELWLRPNGGVFVLSMSTFAASVEGWLTVAGGTGRFEGATGRLEVRGGREAGEDGDRLSYEGEITLRRGTAG